jgi:hypothetical protein
MDAKKKTILAASLILLWAGLAMWQWRLLQEPARVPLTNVTGHPSAGRHAETGKAGLHVNLDVLASTGLQRQETFTTPRNIFSVPRPDGSFAAGSTPVSGNQPSAIAESLTQQQDELELEQYRYLGFLRVGETHRKNRDVAILRKDDEVLVLKVGDHIDDQRILKAIDSESVTIRNTGTHMDQTVLLSEELSEESSEGSTGQE